MKRVFLAMSILRPALVLACLPFAALEAQSIAITQPSAGATLSGYNFQFQVSVTSAPSVARVCYTVDTYPAYNPGINAITTLGCSVTASTFPWPYNSFWSTNSSSGSPHQVAATAYDSLGNVVATSSPVSFVVTNAWPISCSGTPLATTVTTGTPTTSNWSGSVSLTSTVNSACASDSITYNLWVDGLSQYSSTNSSGSVAFSLDTTQFQNGTHNVCLELADATNGTHYTDGNYIGAGPEWCRAINFQNGTTAAQALANAHDIYCSPGGTFNLGGSILNTDGSITASTAIYLSENTSIATVNSSGLVTCQALPTNGSGASAQIGVMTPTLSVSNASNVGTSFGLIFSSAFTPKMTGWLINVSGGTNTIPGVYVITNVTPAGAATLNGNVFTGSSSNATFTTGPTRDVWVFDWTSNTQPCTAGNGKIFSSYTASVSAVNPCIVMFEMFTSFGLLTADQPYFPGPAADFGTTFAPNWTFELGAPYSGISGTESPSGMAAWQAGQNGYVASAESVIAGFPRIKLYLTGDNFTRSGASLWGATNGPAGQWTTPAFQYSLQSWSSQGNVLGIAMQDEVNSSWGGHPLQGPVTPGVTSQSWLSNIIALSGTCIANGIYDIGANSGILIHGSVTSGMNSVAPNGYTISRSGSTSLTFPCPSVANGSYSASTDPLLTIEPWSGGVWYGSGTTCGGAGSACITNAFAQLRSQALAANATFGLAWPNAGLTNCASIANWGGNGTQSVGSISQIADYSDMYPADGTSSYLVSRQSANAIVNATLWLGQTLRSTYGCFNPSLPVNGLTQGTIVGAGSAGFGVGYGYQVGVASVSGNLVTFSAPHGIANILPGQSRLYITGATNSGGAVDSTNNNFYLTDCPTATTCHVLLAATDFSVNGTGGTMTFGGGSGNSTKTLSTLHVTGTNTCQGSSPGLLGALCGDVINYTGSYDATQSQNRGATFTVSGVSGTVTPTSACLVSSSCDLSRTFQLLPENLAAGATTIGQLFSREIPVLASTGGSATIILDNNYVYGRNPGAALNNLNPGWAFGDDIECLILRCSGVRVYKATTYISGYSPVQGLTGPFVQFSDTAFADTTLSSGGQLFMNPHFENSSTVPVFHAHNSASLIWNRLAKYLLQPAVNSPDYGFWMDCGAKAGSPGDVMICLNASDGPQTTTFRLTPYLQSEQQIIRYVVNDHSILMSFIAPGTLTDMLTLQPLDAVFYVFPVNFAAEVLQPGLGIRLADVPNATQIVVRYAYDPYVLDSPINNIFSCGVGSCTPTWDRNIGTIYYRLIYLGSSSQVLATSDVLSL
jgi:hypothetical protein